MVKNTKCVHVRGNVTLIDVNVNQLAFFKIQNITGVWHVIIKDNTLTL